MKYDIVIIGATGFVGSRFIKYYADYFKKEKLEVLATARNLEKLENVLEPFPFIRQAKLNLNDKDKVLDIVKQANLILNFAGPFDLYAEPVVAACAKTGAHYLDITGEVYFAKRMIEKYNDAAKKSRSLIIPFSGFDSIPSDYSVYLASLKMEKHKQKLKSVDIVYQVKGGFNGGTVATAMDMATKLSKKDIINKNYLTNQAENFQEDHNKPRYIKEIKKWVSPFFMEPMNSKIIHRSIFLSDHKRFTDHFSYRESTPIFGGHIGNKIFTLSLSCGGKLLESPLSRKLISKILPKPGEGPSDEVIENGSFKLTTIARGDGGHILKFQLTSKGDPGNKSTIKLIGAAMKAMLKGKHSEKAGLLTPSIAFGENLFPFLEKEQIYFKDMN